MVDTYQAVYDAVRSRFHGCDTSSIVERAAHEGFDFGYAKQILQQEIVAVSHEMQRPSVVFRPRIFPDGDMWCVLLGENLQVGISGFGKTPAEATAAFDAAFWKGETPEANRLVLSSVQPVSGSREQRGNEEGTR